MANMTIEKQRAAAAGIKVLGNKFENAAQVRSVESTLEVGDVFTIPTSLEVYSVSMGGTRRDGTPITAEFIFVENQNGDAKRFFPSMLQKRVTRYKDTKPGEPLQIADNDPIVTTKGTAALKLKEYGDVNKFFTDYAGKKLKVSNVERVTTQNYNDRTRLTTSPVMTIDFVD